jgi:hypothetical protein
MNNILKKYIKTKKDFCLGGSPMTALLSNNTEEMEKCWNEESHDYELNEHLSSLRNEIEQEIVCAQFLNDYGEFDSLFLRKKMDKALRVFFSKLPQSSIEEVQKLARRN